MPPPRRLWALIRTGESLSDNWGSGKNLVNNHGCIVEIDGNWYVAYHRPTHGTSSMRKACLEPITFNADGTIQEVEMTTQGVGGPMSPLLRMDASRACLMSGHLMVTVRRPVHDVPVEYLSEIRDGDCAYWKYYDFDQAKVRRFQCKTWGDNKASAIEIRLDSPDGRLIGRCELEPMQGETAYAIHTATVEPGGGEARLGAGLPGQRRYRKTRNADEPGVVPFPGMREGRSVRTAG